MNASFSILATAMAVGLCTYSAAAQSKDLRDIELRRLFEPTSAVRLSGGRNTRIANAP